MSMIRVSETIGSLQLAPIHNRTPELLHLYIGGYWQNGYICPMQFQPDPKPEPRTTQLEAVQSMEVCMQCCLVWFS